MGTEQPAGEGHELSQRSQPCVYTFRPVTPVYGREIIGWRYPDQHAFYNTDPAYADEDLAALLDPSHHHHTVHDAAGRLCGFCCFGRDARVPGGDYADREALDIGLGMHPDLVGHGHSGPFLAAILDFARAEYASPRFRATVAGFNQRSRRMFEKAGFGIVDRFLCDSAPPVEFVILVRKA